MNSGLLQYLIGSLTFETEPNFSLTDVCLVDAFRLERNQQGFQPEGEDFRIEDEEWDDLEIFLATTFRFPSFAIVKSRNYLLWSSSERDGFRLLRSRHDRKSRPPRRSHIRCTATTQCIVILDESGFYCVHCGLGARTNVEFREDAADVIFHGLL